MERIHCRAHALRDDSEPCIMVMGCTECIWYCMHHRTVPEHTTLTREQIAASDALDAGALRAAYDPFYQDEYDAATVPGWDGAGADVEAQRG